MVRPMTGRSMLGGRELSRQGARAVPSLQYLERQPPFSIGPDDPTNETVNLMQMAALGQTAARVQKTATQSAQSAANMVPQGGLFWDGRADTLQAQALSPLLDPREMDGGDIETVAAKLGQASYAKRFVELFGPGIFDNPRLLVAEAMFAVGRYQVEEPSFHPYTSKYDYWLEGQARLSAAEMRGYTLFNDPDKANCGGCHPAQPTRDGLPPLFTDHQYEALGAPRNFALSANQDPDYFDLGVCGPFRSDMATRRNIAACSSRRPCATRPRGGRSSITAYFARCRKCSTSTISATPIRRRSIRAARTATVQKYNDIPARFQANIDVADPPFDRHFGGTPAMTAQDEADIIAFLQTLTDGYKPDR